MSSAGTIFAMIASLKNNFRARRKIFPAYRDMIVTRRRLENTRFLSPEMKESIRKTAKKELLRDIKLLLLALLAGLPLTIGVIWILIYWFSSGQYP